MIQIEYMVGPRLHMQMRAALASAPRLHTARAADAAPGPVYTQPGTQLHMQMANSAHVRRSPTA
jgi:hypothetical protein